MTSKEIINKALAIIADEKPVKPSDGLVRVRTRNRALVFGIPLLDKDLTELLRKGK